MDKQDGPSRPSTMTPGVSTAPPTAMPANISFQPPTPISPSHNDAHPSASAAAGPSIQPGSGPVPIPPPPNPRRHRSGVLMSRVRANSSGTNFRTGVNAIGSKSFGDLGMSSLHVDGDGEVEDEVDEMTPPWGKRENKRVVSDGVQRGSEEDDSMWDNSARFYHHIHSRPASRAPSRQGSPTLSPVSPPRGASPATSASASPIYVRRSLTLPQNGQAASLSPNHIFLQQHLPPTFPTEVAEDHHPATRVILTPTTQEWRELREMRRQEGEELDSAEDTSSGSDESRRSSVHDGAGKSALFGGDPTFSRMPPLKATMSADFLPVEATHTPDPGSPLLISAEDEKAAPLFQPVIIAPSPTVPGTGVVPVAPDTPTHDGLVRAAAPETAESSPELDEDQPVFARDESHAPARFNSIGRRESLRAIRPTAPRAKTKRELEREKLFKELDEELETLTEKPALAARGSVQEIGMGWGLNSRPGSADHSGSPDQPAERSLAVEPTDIFDKHFERTEEVKASKAQEAVPVATKSNKDPSRNIGSPGHKLPPAHLSPTQPMKPSPLHSSSPLNAPSGLPTPDSPYDTPPNFDLPPAASPETHTANLDTIRSYARALANPHPHHARAKSGVASASPPSSPRLPKSRRRDTNRVSLVAGRIVQPFAIPPSTSLPPAERPDLKTRQSTTSLQSFSPFRSPALGPAKSNGAAPPTFNRLDSTISLAPSTGAPSECATPTSETAGGLGGRGIDDYVILKEAGKGAYGLVMRAKVKGPKGEPVGDEVIIKYIIKARILADCWKKHRELGPIPVEIHVMDQLRHLLYNPPLQPNPWDPMRVRTESAASSDLNSSQVKRDSLESLVNTPDSPRSDSSAGGGMFSPTQKYIASEIRHSPERGHPNICKLLDFFEDREFYYLVMPRFGTGVDLFDRVESEPEGLDPFEVRSLLGQLSDAVRFLHSNGIIHRDIKDENVILDGRGRCQLIDFGSAAQWRPGKRWDTFSGTLHYASPEILRGGMYGGKEQDVWALGVVGYVLLVGETPFSDLPDEVLAGLTPDSSAEAALTARCGGEHAEEGKEADGGGSLADAADFVRRCLEMETPERPSADLLCQHRYLRGEGGWVGKKGWIAKGWK